VRNSTFSGNDNSAIRDDKGVLTVINSTFSGNGGISTIATLEPLTFKNTIVEDPRGTRNCYFFPIDLFNSDYNIFSDNSCSSGSGGHSLYNTDTKLGPLADNGGPTKTLALLSGSPAIDKGNDAFAVDTDGKPLRFDQRG
jgi:hypothetical protein